MAAATSTAFVSILRRHQLLEPAQVEEVEQKLAGQFPEPKALARELLQRGWLTAYQINQIGSGKAAELRLGPYVILDRLGEGGMGAVLKARQAKMGRVDALKIIRKERLNNPDALKRFEREVRAAAQLDHPNIVRAYSADEANGTHFLAMQYVEGKDLAQVVKERGPLPVEEACEAIRQAALGLQHAHEQGLVHRDIKPANLLRSNKGGVVKILDMGIARLSRASADVLTQEGSIMGSLDYIAPEQAMDSSKVDIRADLYSLGCTFYHLLTGQVPFPGGEALAKLTKHQMEEPVPVEQLRTDVPAPVAATVRKLMAKKPEDRYQTPAEVVATLADVSGSSANDHRLNANERPDRNTELANTVDYRPTQRWRWPLLAGVLVLGALLVGGGVLWWQMSHGGKGDGNNSDSTNAMVPGPVPDPLPAKYKNGLGMEFVLVPKGKFLMGGGGGHVGTKEVDIAHDFYLGKYEVTQGEWHAVTGQTPSHFSRTGGGRDAVKGIVDSELARFPVESVSWNDAQLFVEAVDVCEKQAGWKYRLPTEAEWEYACRGGPTANKFDYGFDYYLEQPTNLLLPEMANFKDSGKNRTCKVGSYKPNRLGLYDMHGNVWEWCEDVLHGNPKDPKAASQRVDRGGDWRNDSGACRAANRHVHAPSDRASYLGLRLARVPVTHPVPANAPFNAGQARAHQEAWAMHLGTTVETTNSIGMKLVLIPPGKFRMGSPDNEPGREKDGREGPQHEVTLTRPFYLGVYTVTVGQFRAFVKETTYQTEAERGGGAIRRFPNGKWANDPKASWQNPGFEQTDKHPVVCVSWNDAQKFCEWLSQKEARQYSLPTEAQWEYSCRAGSSTKYSCGDNDAEAGDCFWHSGNSGWKAHPVGEKKPNAWGVYDMGGNVRNWCQDGYDKDYYKVSPKENPAGPSAGGARVLRGGIWDGGLAGCRSAYRGSDTPSNRYDHFGFRVVRFPASLGQARP